ncbi:DUF1905 domain-containing protein [Curtobacterium flaccumfaciens]|uniref:DUF1905 domain-containing protein n=2 Tax=Curtobacterium flaccumfaciens TaxID=2035 RepID=UPI0015984F74|nr:DUF1905 domain-containing protein [Curtobacterium flaccumfaciens]QKS86981.1 DUF1905 domain-containing protein [Curtobacterium flaccumfaciens pv. flaccumfaciens]
MELEFRGEVIEWRGPSPFFFAVVPPDAAEVIADLAPVLTYGWGVIPARVTIGSVTWTTSLFPKDGGYLVPLRAAERKRARAELGDSPEITLEFADPDARAPWGPVEGLTGIAVGGAPVLWRG